MINKKGNATTDLLVWVIVVFAFAIAMGSIVYVGGQIVSVFSNIAPSLSTPQVNASILMADTIGHIPDAYVPLHWISVALIIGSVIMVLLGNFLVRVHPIFIVPYIFIMAIVVIISVPLANTYEDLLTNNQILSTSLSGFTGMNYIILHLPIWVTIIGLVGGIILSINILRDKNEINPF